MKVFQLHELTPKQFFNPSPTPKIARLGPQKVKNDPKIKSELKETKKMIVLQLHELTPKQLLNPTQTPKIAH